MMAIVRCGVGKVLCESGKTDEAKKYFEIAFKKSEGRCFVGDDAKYLCVISA